jgi:histidinol-phosphate phosphatase family protein
VTVARAAVFLDRDGTINVDTDYVSRPEDVALIPGAARAIARLNERAIPVIVVSNQSGIGRGYFSTAEYDRVRARIESLLAEEGARVDATYVCPHAPSEPPRCECRKPGTLLFRQAAADHGLDLSRSWYVGDKLRDVEPARALGGRGILVRGPATPPDDLRVAAPHFPVVDTLAQAVSDILGALTPASPPR